MINIMLNSQFGSETFLELHDSRLPIRDASDSDDFVNHCRQEVVPFIGLHFQGGMANIFVQPNVGCTVAQ